MEGLALKNDVIRKLQNEVLALQGFKRTSGSQRLHTGLGPIEMAFPNQTFPTGVIHEFLSLAAEDAAATNGFIAVLLATLLRQDGVCLWVSTRRTLFAPALKLFGLAPERVVFVDLARQKDALWAVEEALKCDALAAVVGEFGKLGFTESRRLQLATEKSRVTGFIHCCRSENEGAVACVARWKITPLTSRAEEGMPGLGFPGWNVRLLKVRNGKPGVWQVEWSAGSLRHLGVTAFSLPPVQKRQTG